jgi:hypothetical protein
MKAKHLFSGMSHKQLEELCLKFPFLELSKSKTWYGWGWRSIPHEKRNEVSKFIRRNYGSSN